MRFVRWVGLVAGCLVLAGCSHLGKKTPTASTGAAPPANPTNPFNPTKPPVASANTDTPAIPVSSGTGILAGQILGGYGQRPPLTYIQVKLTGEDKGAGGAPIDVEASKDGYFTIQGLQPGKHYQLLARGQDGDRRLAGVAYATPPNPRVVIRMSESFHTPQTPPVPPPPVWPGPTAALGAGAAAAATAPPAAATPPPPSWPKPPQGDPSWVPIPRPTYNPYGGGSNPSAPAGTNLGAPGATKPPDPANIAEGPRAQNWSPPVDIKGGPRAAPTTPLVPTVVPSCVLTGQQLVNFALNDLSGQPWEYRSHRSRLTLIDFWSTTCGPCLHAIPHLNILQQKYGTYGLTVIGIAYDEGTPQQRAQKVDRVRGRLQINYTLLLGGVDGRPCPVQTQFAVRAYPTLVLIDETGRILWRGEGLKRQQLAELELILKQRLLAR